EAEGSQGVAAERVREARESLEQARDQAAQEASQLGQSGQREPGGGEEQRGRDMSEAQNVPIPSREDFRTPEEYRRALLEGMEGDVPEQYRALKRRYYEELVHQ
ncbi:MAG: hypothetical protein ACI8PZ_006689, partial [Myxococcota bacterium]